MGELAEAQSERRNHARLPADGLVAEIRGKHYEVLDISFGGIKVNGRFATAGGLIDLVIFPTDGDAPLVAEKAEVRARVERVDGSVSAVRFNHLTDALTKLIRRSVLV